MGTTNQISHGKIPSFLGFSGRGLRVLVSVVCTTGFLLFGYDREYHENTIFT